MASGKPVYAPRIGELLQLCENAGINNFTCVAFLKRDSRFAYEGREQPPRQGWEKLHPEAYNKENAQSPNVQNLNPPWFRGFFMKKDEFFSKSKQNISEFTGGGKSAEK